MGKVLNNHVYAYRVSRGLDMLSVFYRAKVPKRGVFGATESQLPATPALPHAYTTS